MENRTVTAILDARTTDVLDYLADVRNLPEWATEFARELRFEDGKARIVNGLAVSRERSRPAGPARWCGGT